MKIFDISLTNISASSFIEIINSALLGNSQVKFTYATAATLNIVYKDQELVKIYRIFNLIHPDGIGVFIASKYLYGKNVLIKRFTGSDFYPILIKESIKRNWKYFILGDNDETLNLIPNVNPELQIVGTQNGFEYSNVDLIRKINTSVPDILILGLGCPNQEIWIYENFKKINAKVILAVGDGIKVFAGNKIRGPKIIQRIGLEWLIRLLTNFRKYWKRYLIGIPLFIFRVIKFKISLKKESN